VACKNKREDNEHLQSFHSKSENYGMQFTINKIWQTLNFELIAQRCTLKNIGHILGTKRIEHQPPSLCSKITTSNNVFIQVSQHVILRCMMFKYLKSNQGTSKGFIEKLW
jgi:hypothetical protein